MYKKKLALLLCSAALIQSVSVNAATTTQTGGTITFTGMIGDVTCEITGGDENNVGTSADFTVKLPDVSPTALDTAGKSAGQTGYYIQLNGQNCKDGAIANVRYRPLAATPIDSATGNLNNVATLEKAENAQVRILNYDKSILNLSTANTGTPHQPKTITSNAARFDYYAEYYAKAPVTPGRVLATLGYDIEYN